MPTSWFIIVLVILAAGIVYARYQRNSRHDSRMSLPLAGPSTRDYAQERETARLAHLSDDDRAWEAASLQRHQANQAPPVAPTEREA